MIKLAFALFILGLIGAFAPNADSTSPTSPVTTAPSLIDPTTAPTGGEPGIVAGPPNPGFGVHCGVAPLDDSVKTTIHVRGGTPNPPCEGQR